MRKTGCLLLILLVLLIPGGILIGVEVATAHSTYRMITARTVTRVLPAPTAPDLFLNVSGTTDEYVLHLPDFPPGTDSSLFEGETISLLYDTYNNDKYGSGDHPLYDVVAFTLPGESTVSSTQYTQNSSGIHYDWSDGGVLVMFGVIIFAIILGLELSSQDPWLDKVFSEDGDWGGTNDPTP